MSARMNNRLFVTRAFALAAIAILVVVLVSLLGGGKSYTLKLALADASGLRPGSQVLLGGVSVGTVDSLDLDTGDRVIASLKLDPGQVRIGQGAAAKIVGANLLGEKYVALQPGNSADPLPSGTILPQAATTLPTDLDQIVDVLDGDTRARLAALVNEAGTAVAGRRADVGAILRQLPLSLSAATNLLTQMVQDNHTLGDLVTSSNQFVTRINAQSGDLKQVIDRSAGAVTTLAGRAGELRQAVQGAPQTLNTLNRFFSQGTTAVTQLTPAVGYVANSAPELNGLLAAVRPFTQAALPTLNRAASVSPILTKLATQATPTVKQAVPTVRSLEKVARLAKPATAWAGLSAVDLFSIFQGWSRAIQFRDGLSHIFNGNLALDPAIVVGAANKGATAAQRCQNLLDVKNPDLLRAMGLIASASAARANGCTQTRAAAVHRSTAARRAARPQATPSAPAGPTNPVSGLLNGLDSTVNRVLGGARATVQKVLGQTTGTVSKVLGGSTAGLPGGSGSGSGDPSSLRGLLNYLVGR
jgi:phospholipid/cholesterol/gamma-HCH transport system substrate-binding protein